MNSLRCNITPAATDVVLGEAPLDGDIAFLYATRFAQVNGTLTDAQRQKLMKLRDLDQYPCKGAYPLMAAQRRDGAA